MLLRFSVANYRSIHEPVELLLGSGRKRGALREEGPTLAALYGANASGKSNILKALRAAQRAVLWSHSRWNPTGPPPRKPFALDPSAAAEQSVFEVDVLVDGIRHQYGFALGPEAVDEEWLYAYPESRRRTLFERRGQDFQFGRGLKGPNRAVAELVRPNSLFVSAAATNNHEGVQPIYRWFEAIEFAGLEVGAPSLYKVTESMLDAGEKLDVERMLVLADLGITGVSMKREEVDPELVSALTGLFATIEAKGARDSTPETFRPDSTQTRVEFEHLNRDGKPTPIALREESRGTQMWFSHIGPVLKVLRSGGLLVVDELDASLHPRLSTEVLRLFADRDTNPHGAQLLFSTHDTTLLSNLIDRALAREEVWFTEKSAGGSTVLYPLSDFRPRKGEALERGYLQGRYGAVPIVDFAELAGQIE